jgi:hypothetical protein
MYCIYFTVQSVTSQKKKFFFYKFTHNLAYLRLFPTTFIKEIAIFLFLCVLLHDYIYSIKICINFSTLNVLQVTYSHLSHNDNTNGSLQKITVV